MVPAPQQGTTPPQLASQMRGRVALGPACSPPSPSARVPKLSPAVFPAGVDTMASYEEVLHLLRYRNWHTRSLLDRKFKLVCSELNGRYVSNEFQVEVGAGLC